MRPKDIEVGKTYVIGVQRRAEDGSTELRRIVAKCKDVDPAGSADFTTAKCHPHGIYFVLTPQVLREWHPPERIYPPGEGEA